MLTAVDNLSVSTVHTVPPLQTRSTSCFVNSLQAAVRLSTTESSSSLMTTVFRDTPTETRSITGQSVGLLFRRAEDRTSVSSGFVSVWLFLWRRRWTHRVDKSRWSVGSSVCASGIVSIDCLMLQTSVSVARSSGRRTRSGTGWCASQRHNTTVTWIHTHQASTSTVCHLHPHIIRPPGTLVPGRPYVLLQMFFFIFSATRSPSSLGRSPRNFATWSQYGCAL